MQKLVRIGAITASLLVLGAAVPAVADGGAVRTATGPTATTSHPRTPGWPAGDKALGRAPAAPPAGAASGEPGQAVEPDDRGPGHQAWLQSIWNSP